MPPGATITKPDEQEHDHEQTELGKIWLRSPLLEAQADQDGADQRPIQVRCPPIIGMAIAWKPRSPRRKADGRLDI